MEGQKLNRSFDVLPAALQLLGCLQRETFLFEVLEAAVSHIQMLHSSCTFLEPRTPLNFSMDTSLFFFFTAVWIWLNGFQSPWS